MFAFWKEALHYDLRTPPRGGWVILRDPEGVKPNVSLDAHPLRHRGWERLHVDLYSADREAEVERLVGLGARKHKQTYSPDDDFRVLEDPDGNLFCVVQGF